MSQSASARQTQANNSGEVRKRQRTAALQNLRNIVRLTGSRSVLECGSPLPLFVRGEGLKLSQLIVFFDS